MILSTVLVLLLSAGWCSAVPGLSAEASLSAHVSASADLSASNHFGIDASLSFSGDSSIYEGPIEWSDDCDCKLGDNDYFDDILYMQRRYQDFQAVRDFQNYVIREVDAARRDYYNIGSDNQTSLFENERAYQRLRLRNRILRGVGRIDTTTSINGDDASFPLGIAPVPYLEWADPEGEIGVAQAAECEGVPYIVSAFSNTDLEQIAAAARGANLWMETFIFFDRSITQSIAERAEASGYRALVVTVSGPEHGNLVQVKRDGTVLPDYLHVPNIEDDESNEFFYHEDSAGDASGIVDLEGIKLSAVASPKLDRPYLHRHHILSQIELVKGKGFFRTEKVDQKYERVSECIGSFGLEAFHNYLVDAEQSWDDIRWIRKITDLPLVIRGILTGCDAIRAVENGANAVMVSNNGGRGIDSAPATIEALAEVVEALDIYQNIEIYVEGGARWGTDIFKALALGADAVFVGRPMVWGLLHSGKCGVRRVLQLLRKELDRDMALMGTKHVEDIASTMVVNQHYYHHRYRPSDVDARTNQREDRLECPFGYDYDEDYEPSLEDVRELRPLANRYGRGGAGYGGLGAGYGAGYAGYAVPQAAVVAPIAPAPVPSVDN